MMALRALMMALMGTQTAKQMGPKREGEYHDSASGSGEGCHVADATFRSRFSTAVRVPHAQPPALARGSRHDVNHHDHHGTARARDATCRLHPPAPAAPSGEFRYDSYRTDEYR